MQDKEEQIQAAPVSKSIRIKVGVMGSAGEASPQTKDTLVEKAQALARAIAARQLLLLTGATTGIVYVVGKSAHDAGVFHVGVSPAEDRNEHVEKFKLPLDACDLIVYTGFGLKGRNVVLVRSCDIVLFIAGAMGSLNEFTIAHDEGKVIGCLKGTGGVADAAESLLQKFSKDTGARVFLDADPNKLLDSCLGSIKS
ncbi:MAG TPA: hypothetical protein VHR36_05300 [Pyrinomonadaceae bacterium]|nr:hypothetical protein [Pyrinomonadaceae bacterium]